MDMIIQLFNLDISSWMITFFIILSAIIAIYEILGKFSKIIGKPLKWVRKKDNDHDLLISTINDVKELRKSHDESVKQSIRHDEMIKDDISSLTKTVNNIADTLSTMKSENNETKLKELKGSLIRYYNKYKNVGEWSKLEKDAFWDLFDDYEKRGGDGYIHTIVEPVMRELREVD